MASSSCSLSSVSGSASTSMSESYSFSYSSFSYSLSSSSSSSSASSSSYSSSSSMSDSASSSSVSNSASLSSVSGSASSSSGSDSASSSSGSASASSSDDSASLSSVSGSASSSSGSDSASASSGSGSASSSSGSDSASLSSYSSSYSSSSSSSSGFYTPVTYIESPYWPSTKYNAKKPPVRNGWGTLYLYDQYEIPKGAVVEILIRQGIGVSEVGARTYNSTLERKVWLQPGTTTTMWVQADTAGGRIEVYGDGTGFYITGYMTGADYEEMFEPLTGPTSFAPPITWADVDIQTQLGVVPASVIDVTLGDNRKFPTTGSFDLAVRPNGSAVDRRIVRVKGGAMTTFTTTVASDGKIEVLPSPDLIALGKWEFGVRYTELATYIDDENLYYHNRHIQLPLPEPQGTWNGLQLLCGASTPVTGFTRHFWDLKSIPGGLSGNPYIGFREVTSSLDRFVASEDETTIPMMTVNADHLGYVKTYFDRHPASSAEPAFIQLGHFN